MGFNLNKAMAAKEEILKSFTPLELNEGNVQAIFNRCLAKADAARSLSKIYEEVVGVNREEVLEALGWKSPEVLVQFAEKIKASSKEISYLFGQLKGVHVRDKLMEYQYGIFTYQDKKWTTNLSVLLRFYELGAANKTITHSTPRDDEKTLLIDLSHISPTLSPKDPAFPAWWEAHKAEWED